MGEAGCEYIYFDGCTEDEYPYCAEGDVDDLIFYDEPLKIHSER